MIGTSLSEPHTSVTALCKRMCMLLWTIDDTVHSGYGTVGMREEYMENR